MEAAVLGVALVLMFLAAGTYVYMHTATVPSIPGGNNNGNSGSTTTTQPQPPSSTNPCGSNIVIDHWESSTPLTPFDHGAVLTANISYSGIILGVNIKPLESYDLPDTSLGSEDEVTSKYVALYVNGVLYSKAVLPGKAVNTVTFSIPDLSDKDKLALYTCGR